MATTIHIYDYVVPRNGSYFYCVIVFMVPAGVAALLLCIYGIQIVYCLFVCCADIYRDLTVTTLYRVCCTSKCIID